MTKPESLPSRHRYFRLTGTFVARIGGHFEQYVRHLYTEGLYIGQFSVVKTYQQDIRLVIRYGFSLKTSMEKTVTFVFTTFDKGDMTRLTVDCLDSENVTIDHQVFTIDSLEATQTWAWTTALDHVTQQFQDLVRSENPRGF